jgi:hypothetical protein
MSSRQSVRRRPSVLGSRSTRPSRSGWSAAACRHDRRQWSLGARRSSSSVRPSRPGPRPDRDGRVQGANQPARLHRPDGRCCDGARTGRVGRRHQFGRPPLHHNTHRDRTGKGVQRRGPGVPVHGYRRHLSVLLGRAGGNEAGRRAGPLTNQLQLTITKVSARSSSCPIRACAASAACSTTTPTLAGAAAPPSDQHPKGGCSGRHHRPAPPQRHRHARDALQCIQAGDPVGATTAAPTP